MLESNTNIICKN